VDDSEGIESRKLRRLNKKLIKQGEMPSDGRGRSGTIFLSLLERSRNPQSPSNLVQISEFDASPGMLRQVSGCMFEVRPTGTVRANLQQISTPGSPRDSSATNRARQATLSLDLTGAEVAALLLGTPAEALLDSKTAN